MKSSFLKIMALMFALLMVFTACAPTTQPSGDVTDATTEELTTEATITEAATTENATTEGPTTEAAITETEEATTLAASTEAPTTEEAATEEQKAEEPKVKNVLMIGNSFCYYYVEELAGMARSEGFDLTVANLYASGAWMKDHWDNYQSNESFYEFYVTAKSRRQVMKVDTVREALEYATEKFGTDWDVITLQQNNYHSLIGDLEAAEENTLPYAKELYDVIKKDHSGATLYWHQTWSYDIGFGQSKADPKEQVTTVEHRTSMYTLARELSYTVAEQNNVQLIPTGDAWEIARTYAEIGTTLCARAGVNSDLGDYYHDGDIGGGQYLNACVWYEVLMGKSCVGNTWRPTYALSEEKIAILQASAHEAVAAVYGKDYAK